MQNVKELLTRYFNQTATPEERALIEQWLTDPEQSERVVEMIQDVWEQEEEFGQERVKPFEDMYRKALDRERELGLVTLLNRAGFNWIKLAAACLFFLVAGATIGYIIKKKSSPVEKWSLTTAQTGKGQMAQLKLSDGSEVLLQEESMLMFPKQMDASQVLYLEGEASFKMVEKAKPVTIKTKETVTTTRGAELLITAIPGDSTVTVSVKQGKAEVRGNVEVFPMLKLRIPIKDSTAGTMDTTARKTMPLIKLRPVLVKNNESVVFHKKTGTTEMNVATEEPKLVQEEEPEQKQ